LYPSPNIIKVIKLMTMR